MDAIVLAGGRGTRLGGRDKAALTFGGRTSLERVLDAAGAAERTVVVGDPHVTTADVIWTREEPAGAGPVAAIAAGLSFVTAELVAVVAVDLPLLERDDFETLRRSLGGADGVIFVDGDGRDQPLAGMYRTEPLRRALGALQETRNARVGALVRGLALARIVNQRASCDCDTPEDVQRVERVLQGR
ncbi:MAG TPA: NTP transferase domain-containing protein [Actinomycetota bacterium]|jgi:molybdopterin-guanine dinucleotide biosynthesis protein A